MVEYPLTKSNRIRLAQAFRNVPRRDLTIPCAVEGQMAKAFVDDAENPSMYKVQTGPFFYLAGDPACPAAQETLRAIAPWTLFMPSAPGWLEAAKEVHGAALREMDRYSFSPENLSSAHLTGLLEASPHKGSIRRMDAAFVQDVWDKDHYVSLSEFESPADFLDRGIGYYHVDGERVTGAVSSALVCSQGCEISIYIEEEYRCKGIATALAAAFMLWSLDHKMDPHWDAANPESARLALKLGYKSLGPYLAHYLAG